MTMTFTPEFLAQYAVEGPLGQGGMRTVFRGVQRSLGRKVALKFLSPELLVEPHLTRFRAALAQLYLLSSRFEDAERESQAVLRMQPGHAGATRTLGLARANRGMSGRTPGSAGSTSSRATK